MARDPEHTAGASVDDFPNLTHAPIVEAIIFFEAVPSTVMDVETLREGVTGHLVDYPHCEVVWQSTLDMETLEKGQPQFSEGRQIGVRVSGKETYTVQFLKSGLSVSRLAEYERWGLFRSEALRLWEVFSSLLSPERVKRLHVRFINRIDLREGRSVEDVLSYVPSRLAEQGLPLRQHFYSSLHSDPITGSEVGVTTTVQPAQTDAESDRLIVDIDAFRAESIDATQTARLVEVLEQLRHLKNKVFFSLIKEAIIEEMR